MATLNDIRETKKGKKYTLRESDYYAGDGVREKSLSELLREAEASKNLIKKAKAADEKTTEGLNLTKQESVKILKERGFFLREIVELTPFTIHQVRSIIDGESLKRKRYKGKLLTKKTISILELLSDKKDRKYIVEKLGVSHQAISLTIKNHSDII